MNTYTQSNAFVKAFGTNSTSSTITNPAPTVTEPAGNGVVDLRTRGGEVPNLVNLIFYGAGADNAAGAAKVFLWFLVGTLWIPVPVLNVDLTLSACVGVAGASVLNTERFVDTLALTASSVNTDSVQIVSPAGDTVAQMEFDALGAAKVEIRFNKGTATSLNALVRGL